MGENVEVRPYQTGDQASVVKLWSTVFPDDPPWNNPVAVIERKLSVQGELFLVGLSNAHLAGTVVGGFDGVRGWIHKLAVFPEFQGRGIALRLLKAVEEGLQALGCAKINLQVRSSNVAVVAFYESAGYTIEDRISLGKRF
jgi:ribosomal protein S18 acetylase RimI-like enzyme